MLGIIGNDIRYKYLSEIVDSIYSDELYDFIGIDELLLPFNGINSNYEIKQSKLNLLDILKENTIKCIYVGNANKVLKDLCLNNNIELKELFNDSDFVIPNAKLTAFGIIDYLNSGIKIACDEKICIVGFGNIGFFLAKILLEYNAEFSILPSNELEEKYLKLLGYKIYSDDYKILINTVPKNLNWDYKKLKYKKIIDVASSPYGFDIEKINKDNIDYTLLSQLPSKFCPVAAANIIKKIIEKHKQMNYNYINEVFDF